jgi:hypothetical protein
VRPADVFAFLQDQRSPRHGTQVVRIEDGEVGLSARTIRRRLSSVSGLFAYLLARLCNTDPRSWIALRVTAGVSKA